ncbi:FAD-dependent oxidoreductase [Trebonia sp.]|uniref:FAD-dependent oxidoreductase n=1 Tax=Trebonia sp. TaxID=2767075 RepID=UPI0026128511|nr:FAD-dependent oxidoreductase [Trebonia sp.]
MRPLIRAGREIVSVGVIGAGIFGVCAALELADSGLAVTLYEKRDDIVRGTTARNFFRVHRGYHYPRDLATARAARDGYELFARTFSDALTAHAPHHYAIAAAGSRTTAEMFEEHCDLLGIRARLVRVQDLVPGSVEACFEVDEVYYDTTLLRKIAWQRLLAAGVLVEVKHTHTAHDIAQRHDFLVIAVYGALNEILQELERPAVELQYELCEVPIVHAPDMGRSSFVVLDGPFISVAPYGDGCHIFYDVVNSVHERSVGYANPFSQYFTTEPGELRSPLYPRTRFDPILSSARRFLVPLANVTHVGSLFSERVIIPRVEKTDARPTVVTWVSPTMISILSGKVSTSVVTARFIAASIASRVGGAAAARPSALLATDENRLL